MAMAIVLVTHGVISQTDKVVFDVSFDVANSSDKVVQVQSGMFGTKTDKIKLD